MRKPQDTSIVHAQEWYTARNCLGPNGKLSVIMPVYRLGPVIANNITRVCDLLRNHLPFEIIPVDDGSDDATHAELSRIAARHPEVRPVCLAHNSGKGAALKQGFAQSTGSHVLLLDADLDLPPEQIGVFFQVMADQRADIVIGSKRHSASQLNYPWMRRMTSWFYYGLVKALIGLPVHDTQTGMKLFTRPALACAFERMLVKRFAFDLEILGIAHQFGFRIAEAPVILDFGGNLGCLTWRAVREVMTDTLAVFYRLRLLGYYQSLEPLAPPDMPPRFSVVIACPGPSALLDRCLAGLARQRLAPDEILIGADCAAAFGTLPTPVRVYETGRVRPAEKRNQGIRLARGEIVAFIDDDAIACEHWLERAAAYFTLPDVAAVGGPAVTPLHESLRGKLSGRVLANRLVSGGARFRYVPDRVRDVDDLPSCNLMVRRSVLEALGGFRTDYWPGEDTLLCLDIRRKGKLRIIYDPWTIVQHHRRPLFKPHLRQIGRYARHRGFFARRFPETSRRISYMLPSLFLLGLTAGGLAALFLPPLRPFYLSAMLTYGLITLVAALHPSIRYWLLTWLGIVSTHLVYGFCFLQGVFARRMPETVQRFDHPSEQPAGMA